MSMTQRHRELDIIMTTAQQTMFVRLMDHRQRRHITCSSIRSRLHKLRCISQQHQSASSTAQFSVMYKTFS